MKVTAYFFGGGQEVMELADVPMIEVRSRHGLVKIYYEAAIFGRAL